MKINKLPVLLLGVALSGGALAQGDMTLQQERDQIGAGASDINPDIGVGNSPIDNVTPGAAVPDANQPLDPNRPITTPTPGARTIEPGAPATDQRMPGATGTPTLPTPGNGADGNIAPGNGSPTGGNGTPDSNW